MVCSTRRPASHERSPTARRSRLIPAWVGATSSATGLSGGPVERQLTSERGLRLRDRGFWVWSLAIRMLANAAGQDRAAFTRIGRCDVGRTIPPPVLGSDGRAGVTGLRVTEPKRMPPWIHAETLRRWHARARHPRATCSGVGWLVLSKDGTRHRAPGAAWQVGHPSCSQRPRPLMMSPPFQARCRSAQHHRADPEVCSRALLPVCLRTRVSRGSS